MKFAFGLLGVIFEVVYVFCMKNPDEVMADSNGGNSGEFIRRNQPPEHVIIPLLSNYTPIYFPHNSLEQFVSLTKQSTDSQIKRYKSLLKFKKMINSLNP